MFWFIYFFFFVLGAIVGSFLNVVALRYGTGRSALHGRSQCFACGKTLHWHELLPVVSFLLLRGRCGKCKTKISWRYLVVEILSGVMFLAIFLKLTPYLFFSVSMFVIMFFYLATIWSILLVIVLYDLKHKIIPDIFVASFVVLALLRGVVGVQTFLTLLFAGFILSLPFYFLWLISSGRWIGLGDAKIAFGIGAFLGISHGLSAIAFAFWIGALVGLLIIGISKMGLSLSNKNLTIRSEIPFAPFLVLGTALVYFCGWGVFDLAGLLVF